MSLFWGGLFPDAGPPPDPPDPPVLISDPETIEAPLVVSHIEAIDHTAAALARLPHYLARLP